MVSFTFANPQALLFLIAIPVMIVVHLLTYGRAKTKSVLFANFEAIKRVVDAKKGLRSVTAPSRKLTLLIYRVITFSLVILAVAGTTLWYEGEASDQDFMIALDSSTSMLAADLAPTRFDAAKQSASQFVSSIRGDSQVGVVSFSGTAFLALSPTESRAEAVRTLENLRIREVSGTDMASAIILATNELRASNRSRTIILITDGRQTQGSSLAEALRYAQETNVRIYPIGIGTAEGGSFLRNDLISRIDTETLDEIATVTGTEPFVVTNAQELEAAFNQIIQVTEREIPIRLASPLMLIALSLLFIEWGLISTRFRELP